MERAMKRTTVCFLLLMAVVALAAACDGGTEEPQATPTPRAIPSPVAFAAEPQGATLGDPAFEALPGAEAHFGRLGGSIYQIEVPDDWNGRLVLYIHGYHAFAPTLTVDQPSIRGYLIRNGFAWGASSFSSNSLVPGLAADETAALWDLFVQEFGQPELTYVTGHSMGGGGTAISAERYPDRYDGALGLCGIAGNTPEIAFLGDWLVAGAFVAGVTQAEFDPAAAVDLVETRILPALEDPSLHEQFKAMVIDLTGGPRPFDDEGFLRMESANWQSGAQIVGGGVFDNQETVYELGPLSGVSSEEFNASAIRVAGGSVLESFVAGQDITGDVQMPLLTVHTTGDLFVPIHEEQLLRSKVEAAGKGDLLVQRAVRAPGHCGFIDAEWESGLEALIDWVENGVKPEGEDLLAADLEEAGGSFTLAPRLGSAEAEAVPGADGRIIIRGVITLDGEPFDGYLLDAVVRKDGLERACDFEAYLSVSGGHYEMTLAGDGEAHGCGAPGAEVFITVYGGEQLVASQEAIDWPADEAELSFDATFLSEDPDGVGGPTTSFRGSVLDSSGETLPPGTVIEAYVGETLCGVGSLAPVAMGTAGPETYEIRVVGPESVPGCEEGGAVSFRVDGESAEQTGVNDFAEDPHGLELTLP
jgi:pimeloyl-ACP methyl ester carboxylesterase